VLPEGFHCTTNMPTEVRAGGRWLPVEAIEMDLAIALRLGPDLAAIGAYAIPMADVRAGTPVVIGHEGVRVLPIERPRSPALLGSAAHSSQGSGFSFMSSAVSSERPKAAAIAELAAKMRQIRASGGRTLVVGGPAIIHTGAGRYLEAIIDAGWIDVLFAGNALATHDIERALFGTSLGVELKTGAPAAHGHEHHLRAINTIRAAGSIRAAVESGIVTSGIMRACILHGVEYVLAGSIRDDGPLPDVITDAVKAQDRMRELVQGVGVAVMVATTLHSVATGNLLPATVTTICVDGDADTVIKLMDRGTHQAYGLVTDCEFFLKELAAQLPDVKV
jgi:lysine-ketoglutarate reductase/saccharopine dehydrogenase-like protein (TIGR00300 family)